MALVTGIRYTKEFYEGRELPGDYFCCPNHKTLKLSVTSCGRFFSDSQKQAHEIEAGHLLFDCVKCPVGRAHAGAEHTPMARHKSRLCVRCGCTFMRIIGGCLCVSCYNRQREALANKNAKGGTPHIVANGLYWMRAIVQTPRPIRTRLNAPAGLPSIELLQPGAYWLECLATDRAELERFIEKAMPGGQITAFEMTESLHQSRINSGAISH